MTVLTGTRVVRRTLQKPRTTWNVVAEVGDLNGTRTIVVCAHHDAAHNGKFFVADFQ
ncbi:hypothetical protein [Mycobacterium leprae]|uniref:hypothetical protein n=1 Tax=Mycobacterium leprae TaxID=1769 RepID=UPI000AE831C9|nr:hypothetical protein [Mycobacterium leprae]